MTRGQRRIHGLIWAFLGVMLSVLMIISLQHIPATSKKSAEVLKTPESTSSLNFDQDWIRTTIIQSREGSKLQIVLRESIKYPSALVYTLDKQGERDILLGQLFGVGNYSFQLPQELGGILLYDEIQGVEIEKLEFEWD